jgi:hypothetical protein
MIPIKPGTARRLGITRPEWPEPRVPTELEQKIAGAFKPLNDMMRAAAQSLTLPASKPNPHSPDVSRRRS